MHAWNCRHTTRGLVMCHPGSRARFARGNPLRWLFRGKPTVVRVASAKTGPASAWQICCSSSPASPGLGLDRFRWDEGSRGSPSWRRAGVQMTHSPCALPTRRARFMMMYSRLSRTPKLAARLVLCVWLDTMKTSLQCRGIEMNEAFLFYKSVPGRTTAGLSKLRHTTSVFPTLLPHVCRL